MVDNGDYLDNRKISHRSTDKQDTKMHTLKTTNLVFAKKKRDHKPGKQNNQKFEFPNCHPTSRKAMSKKAPKLCALRNDCITHRDEYLQINQHQDKQYI